MPHRYSIPNSIPNPTFTPNNHIFLVQRHTYSRVTSRVLTQQTLACYTSSEAASQHVQAEIKKLKSVINLNATLRAKPEFRIGDLGGGRMQRECYREIAEWTDPRLGKKKVALGVLRMEVRGRFDEEDVGVRCGDGFDVNLAEESTGDVDVDMLVDDDTLVDMEVEVDEKLDTNDLLVAVEPRSQEEKLHADTDGTGDEDDEEGEVREKKFAAETYFRDFHTMIERLRVHDHDHDHEQNLNPVVWPQKRVLGIAKKSSMEIVMGNETMKRETGEISIPVLVSKKRARAFDEDEEGMRSPGERGGREGAKRVRAGSAAVGRPAGRP